MATFGAKLKREREKKKITLEEVAVATKIGTRLLSALEEEKFDQLPGGIFNKGFIRAYARHLGLDEEKTIAEYVTTLGEQMPAPPEAESQQLRAIAERKEKENNRPKPSGVPWGIVAILLLLIALGLSVWGFYSRDKSQAENLPLPAAPDPPGVALNASTDLPPSQTIVPIPASQKTVSSDGPSSDPASGSATPSRDSASASSSTSGTDQQPTASESAPFSLIVRAHEDSSVTLTVDGKVVFQGLLYAAGEKTVLANQQVVLRAGNAVGLDIMFNGKKISPQGTDGQAKVLTFNGTGLESVATAEP